MHEKRFKHTESHKLEDPERLNWLPPSEVLEHLKLAAGMYVADIGVGTGYFAIPIAQRVLPGGKVAGVDPQPEMLAKLKEKLVAAGAPANIELVLGEAADTTLSDGSCDRVLMANVWHEIDDRPAALQETGRILKLGGKLAILDWRPDVQRPPGPPLEHRISPDDARVELEQNGWGVKATINIGTYTYLLMCEQR